MASGQKEINREKIKIGVNVRLYEETHTGIQNFISCLFSNLIRPNDRYQYLFFSTGGRKISENVNHLVFSGRVFNYLRDKNYRLSNILFDNWYVGKMIREQKVKLYISSSNILPLFKPKAVKYLTIVHDLSYLKYSHNPFKIYDNLVIYLKTMMPLVFKIADKIIVPSEFVKKEIIEVYKVKENKIRVIYEGKDPFYYQEKDELLRAKINEKYHLKKYLLMVATNHERKNILGLIEAFKLIKDTGIQLIITGLLPQNYLNNLMRHISENNLCQRIKFLGFVPKEDLRALYSFAELFVYPSFEEGFGLPVLEATACGCLPVCSNTGSLPEIIGVVDLMFDPLNIREMAEKMDSILCLSTEEKNAYLIRVRKHLKYFTWENTAREFIEVFNQLTK